MQTQNGNGKISEKKVYGYITKNPGATAEKIREALGIGSEDGQRLGRLLRKLRDTRHLKAKGTTRSVAYTATGKALA